MIITINSTNADAIFGENEDGAFYPAPLAAIPQSLPAARAFAIFGRRPRRQRAVGTDAVSFSSTPRRDERARPERRRGR